MSTSSHSLCIDNHSAVYSACEQIRAKWEDLATHLFVARPSVEAIKADAKSCADCLKKLLDEWLKRSSPEQPLPSWRGLCNALSHLDQSLSERISAQHQCGCSLCTGCNVEVPIIGLVSPLYNEIYQKLQNSVGVAEYLYSKRAFSFHQLEKMRDSPGNEKEVLFTSLESAVSLNQYNLRVFGKALMKEEATHSLGESLLANCIKEELPPQSKIKEIFVEIKYKKEFQSMRAFLGELCAKTVTLLSEKEVSISDLKNKLKFSFPEMASHLEECTSLKEVVSNVIRPRVSLVQIDYLEAVFNLFKLPMKPIQEYNQKVDELYKTVKVIYGQLLMKELDGSTSELESIKFVLDWEENEHLLKDVQDLFKKIVRSYSSQVKVIVISEGTPETKRDHEESHQKSTVIPTKRVEDIKEPEPEPESRTQKEAMKEEEEEERAPKEADATQLSKKAEELTGRVEDLKELVGAIKITIGRLSTAGTDQEKIHNARSSLDELKTELDGLNSIFSQVEETPGTKQDDDDEESHQKSTVIPTRILEEMKVTSEMIVYFKGSKGYSLDWEEYGCKLHIPKGAIKEEEEGKLHIYAIYDGPFQFPKGMELVSGIYYISLSHHELMKPATLEIQHCSDCTSDESGNSGLSFITIPDTTSGPPYSFDIIEGGNFSANQNYGMIRRSHFCGFAVAFINGLWRFFGYGISPNDESSPNEAEKTSEKHSSLGILHFLIANTTKKSCVILYLIKHLDLHKQHIEKQLTTPKKNIVGRKLKKITLKDEAVQVAVSKAEKNSRIIDWNGYPLKIVSHWQISSESTGDSLMLHPDEIEDMLAPSFDIQIDWIGGGMTIGKYSHQFRIHILGIQGAYSFPVSVPLVPFMSSSSIGSVASGSSIDEEEEVLRDPPQLKEFLVNVVKRLRCGSDKLAVHLLNEDSRVNYNRAVKTQGREDDKDYTILFEEWQKEGTERTWQKIINALESVGEKTLANNLKESYGGSEVFF